MVCLDTDILVGVLRNDGDAIMFLNEIDGDSKRTTAVSAYELLKGAATSSRPDENLALVGELLGSLSVLPLDGDSCDLASNLYAEARKRMLKIGEFDILVASIAMQNGETLISRDKHFNNIENLSLRSW